MFSTSNMGSLARSCGMGAGGRRRRRQGGNLWDSIKSGFNKVKDFVKEHKLISRGLSLLPHPAAKAAGFSAGLAGYGRRRRAVRRRPIRRRGGSLLGEVFSPRASHGLFGRGRRRAGGNKFVDFLKKSHKYVKDKRLISRALRDNGFKRASNFAGALGYGRRRRVVRRRRAPIRRRAGGSLKSILQKAHAYVKKNRLISNAIKHFGQKRLGNAVHTLGYGRRRRVVRRRRVMRR